MTHRLSPEEFFNFVYYNPFTGTFRWEKRERRFFVSDRIFNTWNSRFAGKEFLCRIDSKGYLYGMVSKQNVFAHRAAIAWGTGEWPDGEVDHIDHDPKNNRLENLRVVDRAENAKNRSLSAKNQTGRNGVYRSGNRFKASIGVDGVCVPLGGFATFEQASHARKQAEIKYGYHKNHG